MSSTSHMFIGFSSLYLFPICMYVGMHACMHACICLCVHVVFFFFQKQLIYALSYNSETEDSLCLSRYIYVFQFLDPLTSFHKMFFMCVLPQEAFIIFCSLKSAWQDYRLTNWECCQHHI